MATPAQIAANRRNAQKSTGPKTKEGKQKVSQNGLKHGLASRWFTPEDLIDPRMLQIQTRILMRQHEPKTPEETCLVETLAEKLCISHALQNLEIHYFRSATAIVQTQRIGAYTFDRLSRLMSRTHKETDLIRAMLAKPRNTKANSAHFQASNPTL